MNKYMVLVEGKGCPIKFHDTYEEACTEAKRLALKEGIDTYILKKVAYVEFSAEVKKYVCEIDCENQKRVINQCQCGSLSY